MAGRCENVLMLAIWLVLVIGGCVYTEPWKDQYVLFPEHSTCPWYTKVACSTPNHNEFVPRNETGGCSGGGMVVCLKDDNTAIKPDLIPRGFKDSTALILIDLYFGLIFMCHCLRIDPDRGGGNFGVENGRMTNYGTV